MNPFKKKKRPSDSERSMILDTCSLIDGRILDIAKAGFATKRLVVPQFVIAELQYLADNGDSMKRERARFGLDVIRNLQDLRRTTVVIAREQFPAVKEVDDKLIALAKLHGGMLYTTDYNLNKVAQIEGVTVLNVNELAHALRPQRLPGERIELKITQVGQDKTQGVGYLEDGTMVVVEKAAHMVGQRIQVEFSRMLQTQAGKMMFAVLPANAPKPAQPEQVQQHHQQQQPVQKQQSRPQERPARPSNVSPEQRMINAANGTSTNQQTQANRAQPRPMRAYHARRKPQTQQQRPVDAK